MKNIKTQNIIIFDGVCGLCDSSIRLLIKLDAKRVFKYTSLQGKYVKSLKVDSELDSIVFYNEGEMFYKSTAILKICKELGGIWTLTQIFYLIPRFLRDGIYDIIAKYRYKIFGKMESCRMPNKEEESLFLH